MKSKNQSYNIPERFLRQLWINRQFSALKLRTTDNQPIEVITTGKSNSDAGPDFSDARIRIGGVLYRGDVEIHQRNQDWFQHKHHKDSKYNSVILHVVFDVDQEITSPVTKSKREIPVLQLEKQLSASLRSTWERMILDERAERLSTLECYSKNQSVNPEIIQRWLTKLAMERIELKIRRYEERLKELIGENQLHVKEPLSQYGEIPFGLNPEELPAPDQKYSIDDFRKISFWDQILYEGIMEALGYSKNQEPFLKLARNMRLKNIRGLLDDNLSERRSVQVESILFGAAGLLMSPKKTMDLDSKKYLRTLRAIWKNNSAEYTQTRLNLSEWQFFRLRPDNFPTIRIAGASQLICNMVVQGLFKSVAIVLKNNELNTRAKYRFLQSMFLISADEFWKSHYRFGEQTSKDITTLIGKNRADDIVLNAVVPITLLYARIFKDKDVRQNVLKIIEGSPASTENTITKIIDRQIIREKFKLKSTMLQQGALQLYKFYCVEGKCSDCQIGKSIQN